MIGVVARAEEAEAAAEFFELFKTPWERALPGRRYSVLLTTTGLTEGFEADVLLAYGSQVQSIDERRRVEVVDSDDVDAEWEGRRFPLYAGAACFESSGGEMILRARSGAVGYRGTEGARKTWRIGYNLFAEVRYLLDRGQPAQFALIPTLELHIALLRQLMLESGASFVEIPPKPAGHDFICCLTHDIDFFGIKRHKWDRTLAGFAYRATIGTLLQLVQRRRTVKEAITNWMAAGSLPLVFAGLARDWWQPFEDYARADGDRASTYFLAPFKQRSGRALDGTANDVRALPYDVTDIGEEIGNARRPRKEFGVHGIDAWHDTDAGRAERARVAEATGAARVGVRMHWLYSSPDSTRCLEAAGFDYDSTCGYNDAVGFRAGTLQAFRPLGRSTLMELPLSIMDSAMLYPGRMALSPARALDMCRDIIATACRFGGALVINWHDRSLAPERLWVRPYRELLNEVEKNRTAWFATAGEAVDWFRWRRSIQFRAGAAPGAVTVESQPAPPGVPAGRLVIHRPHDGRSPLEEIRFSGGEAICSPA